MDSEKGFVAKEEMPEYLSNLFRARPPLPPIPAMPKAKYRSLEALQGEHRTLEEIFEQAKARHFQDKGEQGGEFGRQNRETKEEKKLRIKREQVEKSMSRLKTEREQCKYLLI